MLLKYVPRTCQRMNDCCYNNTAAVTFGEHSVSIYGDVDVTTFIFKLLFNVTNPNVILGNKRRRISIDNTYPQHCDCQIETSSQVHILLQNRLYTAVTITITKKRKKCTYYQYKQKITSFTSVTYIINCQTLCQSLLHIRCRQSELLLLLTYVSMQYLICEMLII